MRCAGLTVRSVYMSPSGTIRPNLNGQGGTLSLRRIQPEPTSAFHDPCPESRYSASGHDRLYGFAPIAAVQIPVEHA